MKMKKIAFSLVWPKMFLLLLDLMKQTENQKNQLYAKLCEWHTEKQVIELQPLRFIFPFSLSSETKNTDCFH